MKKILLFTLILAAALCIGCGRKKTLYVYNWADYMNPEVLEKFEKQYDCSVVMNYFDSNEALYAKLKAGATGYDVLFPSDYMSRVMYEQGMLMEIDHSRLTNLKNLDESFTAGGIDSGMKYSVPYMVTYCGIAYNKNKVKDFKPSWSMFDRTDLKGRMTMLNDVREAIGAALKFNGFSYNSTDPAQLKKAGETAVKWKKNIAKFDVDEAKRGLSSGEFYLIQVYNGDAMQIIAENEDLAFAFPEEGTSISQDDFVISADSKNTDLAYKFIDFLLEAENAAANMEFVSYMSPNKAALALMDSSFVEDPAVNPKPAILRKSDHLMDLGKDNLLYSELWDCIKSSK